MIIAYGEEGAYGMKYSGEADDEQEDYQNLFRADSDSYNSGTV